MLEALIVGLCIFLKKTTALLVFFMWLVKSRTFTKSGAIEAVYIQGFLQDLTNGLFHKLKSYGISGQIFGLILSCVSNRRLLVVLDQKSSQEFAANAGVPEGSILGPAYSLFFLYIDDPSYNVISNIAVYTNKTTLHI